MIKKFVLGLTVSSALLMSGATAGFAAANPSGTGQPNQSCQAQPSSPGNAANTSGAAFNPTGTAATHYAGQQPQNSQNPRSVSQYDVACYQVSQH
jgi:hypothetical protein